jgi:hypothetical protein
MTSVHSLEHTITDPSSHSAIHYSIYLPVDTILYKVSNLSTHPCASCIHQSNQQIIHPFINTFLCPFNHPFISKIISHYPTFINTASILASVHQFRQPVIHSFIWKLINWAICPCTCSRTFKNTSIHSSVSVHPSFHTTSQQTTLHLIQKHVPTQYLTNMTNIDSHSFTRIVYLQNIVYNNDLCSKIPRTLLNTHFLYSR